MKARVTNNTEHDKMLEIIRHVGFGDNLKPSNDFRAPKPDSMNSKRYSCISGCP